MAHLNKVMLLGHLTRDPVLRQTPKGAAVAEFGLAINRSYRAEDGAVKEEVTFVDLEAWGKLAETVARYLAKGSPCLVEGRLKLETWEDKQGGGRRSRLRVVTESVQFLPRGGAENAETPAATPAAPARAQPPASRPSLPPQQARGRRPVPAGVVQEPALPF